MSHPGWNSAYSPLGSPEQFRGQQWSGVTQPSNDQQAFLHDIGNEPDGRYYDLSPEIDNSAQFNLPKRPAPHRGSTHSITSLLSGKENYGCECFNGRTY